MAIPQRIAFVLVTVWMLAAVQHAEAQSNLVQIESIGSLDQVVKGGSYYTETDIEVSGTLQTIATRAVGFTIIFNAPGESNLTVGTYSDVVQYPYNTGGSPGLTVFRDEGTCTNECGDFEIREIESNGGGQITRLWATFRQRCDCVNYFPLTGEIRYNSGLAPQRPPPRTIRVPQDFSTIQEALDHVNPLSVDTILVEPGTYSESVRFGTNSVHLVSVGGASRTVIVAPAGQTAVTIGEVTQKNFTDTLLCGFTLRNGGLGISISRNAGPVIISNVIESCEAGITCNGGMWSPQIRWNVITNCLGAAVNLSFTANTVLESNRIEGNGWGVEMIYPGAPRLINNLIRANRGDGLKIHGDAEVIQNLIVRNGGDGIFASVSGGARLYLLHNTIADNGRAGVQITDYDYGAQLKGNIIVGNPALWIRDYPLRALQFNNIYALVGAAYYQGEDYTGVSGNITRDPFFACQPEGDYRLVRGSPCIDAGTSAAFLLPTTDLDGQPRLAPGGANEAVRIDMGAFEFARSNTSEPCLFLECPSNMSVVTRPGENSAVVTYPPAFATPGALMTYSVESGSTLPSGKHTVSVTAVRGTNYLNCGFSIAVYRGDDFGLALDTTNVDWSTAGDAHWFVQNSTTKDGLAAQSSAIDENQKSTLTATLSGPGLLSFWWKALGEFALRIDGLPKAKLSGDQDWRLETMYVGHGAHTIEWSVERPQSWGIVRNDTGWLDMVTYQYGVTAPPLITSQPSSLSILPGRSATFSVQADGTPPIRFQWLLNGLSIGGATQASFTIPTVQSSHIGTYSAILSNSIASTNSVEVRLTLAEVVGWGANYSGQAQVPLDLTNVMAIAGGWRHSVVLRPDGTVTVWGANNAGQANVPPNLSNVIAISSRSGDFAMALNANGKVVVWGDNSYQQTNVPPELSDVVAIAAGRMHCLALRADGTVVSWGHFTSVPATLSNVVAIAAGDYASLALHSDGTVTGWGDIAAPSGLSNVTAIAAGGLHNLAVTANGRVVSWGLRPTIVPATLSNVVAVAAADYDSFALRSDGTVVRWGRVNSGPSPIYVAPLAGLSNVVAIATGGDHYLALIGQGPPVLRVQASKLQWDNDSFRLFVPTRSGRVYRLEHRDILSEGSWNPLPLVPGTGSDIPLRDLSPTSSERFYRVREW